MTDSNLFPGFTTHRIQTSGAEIRCSVGGSVPPLLLLHGYPQTHAIWHKIAPSLAHRFTVVCADLRGYGDSSKPPSDPQHAATSKRAMAEYERCFRDPTTIHATCEDYRAAAAIDLEHDAQDADRRVTCPLLVLWGEQGVVHRFFKPVEDWRSVADDVRGKTLPCGHYLAEEDPHATLFELKTFFSDDG